MNLTSCFLVSQAVVGGMRARRWGRIVNISSVAAQLGGAVGPHYAASKAGMIGLTHGYAKWLAREGVTANAIAPALVDTEMVTSNPNAHPSLIPVGRFGHVDEVADVVVMLAGKWLHNGADHQRERRLVHELDFAAKSDDDFPGARHTGAMISMKTNVGKPLGGETAARMAASTSGC